MTLSPNRSYKNLTEIRGSNGSTNYFSFYYLTRVVLPVCLLASSILIYVVIYSLEDAQSSGTSSDVHISISDLWRESLKYQVSNIKENAGLQQRASDLDITDLQYIAEFKPFDLPSGINVWDLYYPQVSCPDVVRLGRYGEGGKWVCGMSLLGPQKIVQHQLFANRLIQRQDRQCVMYSFGISTDISFEVEILLTTNCVIHAFDPTVGSLPFQNLNHNLNGTISEKIRNRIHFHKIALNDKSGSTEYHTLNEHLYDIMLRLNHTFIDLLKVDVEGSEWDIFDQLFKHKIRVPVGELMIELHHKSMIQTNSFFVDAAKQGFIPFSREINLIPTFGGGDPFAVEYSFVNYENLFHGAVYPVPEVGARLSDWPSTRPSVRAVIYILTQARRVKLMSRMLQSLYDNFYVDYPLYPIVIFHDDLTTEHQQTLKAAVPRMKLTFIEIKLSLPDNLIKSGLKIPDRTVCDPKFSTIGYRHMCRFHATVVHSTLAAKGYANVEYIMRLDDDSLFTSPIGYDMFHYMKVNKKLYGFVNTVRDDDNCVINLWNTSRAFVTNNKITLQNGTWLNDWLDPIVIYNNFEISHVSVWKSELWKSFMNHIDNEGGIYLHRWGDAPLHTIGASMIVPLPQVHSFTDIAYTHEQFVKQKPSGLPMPNIDPFSGNKIKCTYYDKWSCGQIGHNDSDNSTSINGGKGSKEAAVLYTFGGAGVETKIAATINSFHTQFAGKYHYPFVVFYSDAGKFNVKKVKEVLSVTALPMVSFVPVKLSIFPKDIESPCILYGPEGRAVSLFLRYKVGDILRKMKFEWFMRFGFDSHLVSPVKYDLFKSMRQEGKKFGYLGALTGAETCYGSMFDHGHNLCGHSAAVTSPPSTCSGLMKEWPRNNVIMTDFEVSHYSVWESPMCTALFASVGEDTEVRTSSSRSHKHTDTSKSFATSSSSKALLSANKLSVNSSASMVWNDAGLHTMCVIMSLQKDQIIQLHNMGYQYNWNSESSFKEKTTKLSALDKVFSAQRVGWLGGDVAASIPLPNEADPSTQPNKLVWLFGDSFIGASTASQRVFDGATIIQNSVGVSTMDETSGESGVRNVKDMRYYWNHDTEGSPTAIFSFSEYSCAKSAVPSKPSFWPLTGLSVTKKDGHKNDVKLVVAGSVVCLATGFEGNAMDIELLASVVIVVSNPYDHPDLWKYSYKTLPSSKPAGAEVETVKWVSMAASSGGRFAHEDDVVYVTGSYVHQAISYQTMYRVKADALLSLQFDQIEVIQTDGKGPGWSKAFLPSGAGALIPGKVFAPARSEGTLFFDSGRKEWLFVDKDVVNEVELCRSTEIAGPWKCSYIAQPPKDPRLFYYAGKAHPDLMKVSTDNNNKPSSGLVVSYVSNSMNGFSVMFDKEYHSEYLPKFLLIEGI